MVPLKFLETLVDPTTSMFPIFSNTGANISEHFTPHVVRLFYVERSLSNGCVPLGFARRAGSFVWMCYRKPPELRHDKGIQCPIPVPQAAFKGYNSDAFKVETRVLHQGSNVVVDLTFGPPAEGGHVIRCTCGFYVPHAIP